MPLNEETKPNQTCFSSYFCFLELVISIFLFVLVYAKLIFRWRIVSINYVMEES